VKGVTLPLGSSHRGRGKIRKGTIIGFAMTRLRPLDFDAAGKPGWIPVHGRAVSGMTMIEVFTSTPRYLDTSLQFFSHGPNSPCAAAASDTLEEKTVRGIVRTGLTSKPSTRQGESV